MLAVRLKTRSECCLLNSKKNLALFKAYVQLTRPLGIILIGFATVVGQIMALKRLPESFMLVFPLLASALATASSFAINDYLDVDIDRINNPERPIPSGVVSRKSALRFGIALFLAGFFASLPTNFMATCILTVTYGLSVFYSLFAKRTGLFGNIIVAFCVSIGFVYGSISVTNSINPTVLYLSLLSFLQT